MIAYRPGNKHSNFINHMKDQRKKEKEKDVVYKVPCLGCSKIIEGQTSMLSENRLYHHKGNLRGGIKNRTAMQ